MTTDTDFALFALNAYFRQQANQGPIPPGWELFDEFRPEESSTDFSAVAYRRIGTNEVVIAYTGSDSDPVLASDDWLLANAPAFLGVYSPQVRLAIKFYADVRAEMTRQGISPDMPITLTGHSLGGGLASVVSVLFDQPAKVFDAAPFQSAVHNALGHVPFVSPAGAFVNRYFEQYRDYQQGLGRPIEGAFAQYEQAHDHSTGFNSQFVLRERNVEAWSLDGEALMFIRTSLSAIEGIAYTPIPLAQDSLNPIALHSMELLTATQLSANFYSELSRNGTLQQLLFDETLYTEIDLRTNATPDFLMNLVRNQVGVPGFANNDGNGLLDTFAGDIESVVSQSIGLPISGQQRTALLAGVFDYYYLSNFLNVSATPAPFVRHDGVTGGFVFDFTLMADDPAQELGRQRMVTSFVNLLDGYRQGSAQTLLNQAERWYIQNDTGPMTATGAERADVFFAFYGPAVLQGMAGNDILVGGIGNDILYGGHHNDVLFGSAGIDVLDGGEGTDYLSGGSEDDSLSGGSGVDTLDGGKGTDTYFVVDDPFNIVTIRDEDGLGLIQVQGSSGIREVTTGLLAVPGTPGAWRNVYGDRFALAGGTLTVRLIGGGTIWIENYQPASTSSLGQMSIGGGATAATFIAGDETPMDGGFSTGWLGIILPGPVAALPPPVDPGARNYYADAAGPHGGLRYGVYNNSYYESPAVYSSSLTGPETIDLSAATPASGLVSIGAFGGFGDSHMIGGAYRDWLFDDEYFDGSQYQLIGTSVGNDVLIGAGGEDWLEARGGNDELYGGEGNDFLFDLPLAGPNAFADVSWVRAAGNSSNDMMYGESGDDILTAAGGSAHMDGGTDNDELYGGQDGDVLLGGDGNDVLSGDTRLNAGVGQFLLPLGQDPTYSLNGQWVEDTTNPGVDILDGGAGNDTLLGGGLGDFMSGGADDDVLQGDTLFVPGGTRALFANHGTTPVALHGNDQLFGDAGSDTLYGGGGEDWLFGGVGNDTLFGDDNPQRNGALEAAYHRGDHLFGDADNDLLYGNGGDDELDGGDGDDFVYGGAGDDTLLGGAGLDHLVGDDSAADVGNDVIYGGDNDDQLFGKSGDDQLFGDAGADQLVAGDGNDLLEGGDGHDVLFGEAGNDTLRGGLGLDELSGGDGEDVLEAGAGDPLFGGDVLFGDAGNDRFVLGLGSGDVQITDTEGTNRLVFGSGIGASQVAVSMSGGLVFIDYSPTDYAFMDVATFERLAGLEFADGSTTNATDIRQLFTPGSTQSGQLTLASGTVGNIVLYRRGDDLLISQSNALSGWADTSTLNARNVLFESGNGADYGLASTDQVLVLNGWYRANPNTYINSLVDPFLGTLDLMAAASSAEQLVYGSANADYLAGADAVDLLIGSTGADALDGRGGDDELAGGVGDDTLLGGAGNDTYRYNSGDGEDLILDESGSNDVVSFGPGITSVDLTVSENAAGLQVQVGPSANGDSLLIINWAQGGTQSIDRFAFNNGTSLDRAQIDALNTGNHSPRVSSDLFVRARSNQPFSYTVPAGTITDSDAGDTLTYAAKLDDGRALPAWLTFNPATLTFSGTPTPSEAGDLNVAIQVTDSAGLSNDIALQIDVMGIINGTAGADNLTAPGPAGMEIHGLAGNDIIYGAEGGDELFGEDGDDNLESMGGDDLLNGGAGVDYLAGGDGNDVLDAGPGNDYLRGDYGANVLIGGPGNDYFADGIYEGHVSSNTIRLGLGDGADYTAQDSLDGDDTIEFGPGISAVYVRASMYIDTNGHLFLPYNPGNAGDRIEIAVYDWLGGDAVGGSDAVVRFATGESYTIENLFAELHVLTEGDNYYITFDGTPIHTLGGSDLVLYRGSGNFFLSFFGGEGNDHLDAGLGGGDQLDGGPGNDTLLGSPGASTLIGGAGNDYLAGGPGGDDVLNGGDGDDTYSLEQQSLYGGTDTIVEAPGGGIDAVIVDTSYTLGANLESVTYRGGAPVVLTGNDLDNVINGGSNNDTLIGGLGNDSLDGGAGYNNLIGGAGNDVYLGADQGQLITEYAGEGIDTVHSSDTAYQLGSNLENLVLISTQASDGSGNELDNVLIGNSRNNYLSGDDGNDVLDGGAGGTDVLAGGYGDDIYVVARTSGISISENPDEGADLVQASVTYTLGSNLENLTLTGTGAINGTGNSLANVIIGNSGNNALSGGTGADALIGGAGNDTYTVDNVGDAITELGGEGTDLVNASVSYTLVNNVENLTLTGSSALSGTGNSLDNVLTGNSGNNALTGGAGNDTLSGGTGSDTMVGGQGNDTYVVAQTGDVVTELAGEGIDLVQSSITHTLANNVDNLTLTGTTAINGTGNTLDNVLTGNSGNNTLTGLAGNDVLDGGTAGTDALRGGTGNDTYIVARTTGITITENASEGTDRVQSSVTYTLGNNLENLTLTGTSAINGTGNTLNNTVVGNGAINTLSGGTGADVLIGNAGNDTLTGGNGADTYQYASGDGADIVNDAGTDGASDLLGFTNLAFSQVTLARSTNDLLISRNGSATDSVRVTNWFTVTGNQIETVQFTDQALTNTQINSLIGGGSFAARIDPELERGFLSFLGAINGFKSREDMVADLGARATGEPTLEMAINSVDAAIVRGGAGRGLAGHTTYHQL